MTPVRSLILPAVAACALTVVACSSTTKTSTDSGSTTTVVATTSVATTAAGTSTTAAVATTTKATTPAATNPPATNAPTTAAQIITSFSVSQPAACPAPDVTFVASPPSVTVSWTVVGADSVNLLIDGGLWGTYGLSGSESLPASCDASMHNVHSYSVVAIKGGQQIATKSATRGF